MPTVMLRPMSTGEVLDVAFGIYRRHLATLVTVSVLLTGLPLLVLGALAGVTAVFSSTTPESLLLLMMGVVLVYLILTQLALGASLLVVSQGYLGRNLSAGSAIRQTLSRLGMLVLAALLVGLVVGLGALLVIVPGVILFCGLIVTTPVVMLEKPESATAAMGRAWALTKGYRWRMFLLILVGVVLSAVVIIGVNVITGLIFGFGGQVQPGAAPGLAPMLAQQAIQLLGNMIIAPLPHCILTVAYYDLRVRKEAFDLELLAGNLQPA